MERLSASRISARILAVVIVATQINSVLAGDYAIRQITNFGHPETGSSAVPVGAINDRLVFFARDGEMGLYGTDGSNVELIDNILLNTLAVDPTGVAQLGDELYFSAATSDGRELHATDGHSLRQVADLAPGAAGSNPSDFITLNDRLLFSGINEAPPPGGTPVRFFHTDGTTIAEFSRSLFPPGGSVQLNDRLFYAGLVPGSGGPLQLSITDGESLSIFATPPIVRPLRIVQVGDHVYFVAGEGAAQGIYRANGVSGGLVSLVDDFTSINGIIHTFENDDSLVLTMRDSSTNELVFFETNGSTPSEILRWSIPTGLSLTTTSFLEPQPEYFDNSRAYFVFDRGLNRDHYVFDGTSFNLALTTTRSTEFEFTEIGDRLFLNASQLFEIIDDELVPIGVRLEHMFAFNGEVFGYSPNQSFFDPGTLWQLQDGALTPLGNVVSQSTLPHESWVEFGGQLYFAGQSGNNKQLYAIVPVPEPVALPVVAISIALVLFARRCRTAA